MMVVAAERVGADRAAMEMEKVVVVRVLVAMAEWRE
jgi:hypothetical protein